MARARLSIAWVTDSELVARARDGDTHAFAELMERHGQAVYRAALAALGSPADAEEVAQESFLRAYRRLDTFREECEFPDMDVGNRMARRIEPAAQPGAPMATIRSASGNAGAEPATCGPTCEEALIAAEEQRNMTRLIRTLPARLRDPLLLVAACRAELQGDGGDARRPRGHAQMEGLRGTASAQEEAREAGLFAMSHGAARLSRRSHRSCRARHGR